MHFRDNASQYNVLIVDDDPVILNLLTHLLEMGHYRVRSASDGNQALQMVLQDCPDILIADWFMPGLDGLELCRRVRQLHARKVLPHYSYILVLTIHSSRNSIIEALEAGADDFIQKDVTCLSDFRAEIQARLNAAQRIRRLEIDLEQFIRLSGGNPSQTQCRPANSKTRNRPRICRPVRLFDAASQSCLLF